MPIDALTYWKKVTFFLHAMEQSEENVQHPFWQCYSQDTTDFPGLDMLEVVKTSFDI